MPHNAHASSTPTHMHTLTHATHKPHAHTHTEHIHTDTHSPTYVLIFVPWLLSWDKWAQKRQCSLTKISLRHLFSSSAHRLGIVRSPEPTAKEYCKSPSSTISNNLTLKRVFVLQINLNLFWGWLACQGGCLERPKRGFGQHCPQLLQMMSWSLTS